MSINRNPNNPLICSTRVEGIEYFEQTVTNDGWQLFEFIGPRNLIDINPDFEASGLNNFLNIFIQNPKIFHEMFIRPNYMESSLCEVLSLRAHRSRWLTIMALLWDFSENKSLEHITLSYDSPDENKISPRNFLMGKTRIGFLDLIENNDDVKCLIFLQKNKVLEPEILAHSKQISVDYIVNTLDYNLEYKTLQHYNGGVDYPLILALHKDRDLDEWDHVKFVKCVKLMKSFCEGGRFDLQLKIKFVNQELYDMVLFDHPILTRDDNYHYLIELKGDLLDTFEQGYLCFALMHCFCELEADTSRIKVTKSERYPGHIMGPPPTK